MRACSPVIANGYARGESDIALGAGMAVTTVYIMYRSKVPELYVVSLLAESTLTLSHTRERDTRKASVMSAPYTTDRR